MKSLTFFRILMMVARPGSALEREMRVSWWFLKFRLWFNSRQTPRAISGLTVPPHTSAACLREKRELRHYSKSQPKDYAP